MTRAQERLYLSFADRRRLFGVGGFQAPSPFLSDIPEELIEGDTVPRSVHIPLTFRSMVTSNSDKPFMKRSRQRTGGIADYRVGDRIRHRDFGDGTVLSKSGGSSDLKIRVLFRNAGTKTLLVRLAPIKKIG